ncbi:MAG: hypothetical protein V4621_01575 [Pseudomonadota bacterium]
MSTKPVTEQQAAQTALDNFRGHAGNTFGGMLNALVQAKVVSVGRLKTEFGIPHAAWQRARDGDPETNVPSEIRESFIAAMVNQHSLYDTRAPNAVARQNARTARQTRTCAMA